MNKQTKEDILREHRSEMGKLSHKKSPRTRKHFEMMWKKSAETRAKNKAQKISTEKRVA